MTQPSSNMQKPRITNGLYLMLQMQLIDGGCSHQHHVERDLRFFMIQEERMSLMLEATESYTH